MSGARMRAAKRILLLSQCCYTPRIPLTLLPRHAGGLASGVVSHARSTIVATGVAVSIIAASYGHTFVRSRSYSVHHGMRQTNIERLLTPRALPSVPATSQHCWLGDAALYAGVDNGTRYHRLTLITLLHGHFTTGNIRQCFELRHGLTQTYRYIEYAEYVVTSITPRR